jgi:hypothetical protein
LFVFWMKMFNTVNHFSALHWRWIDVGRGILCIMSLHVTMRQASVTCQFQFPNVTVEISKINLNLIRYNISKLI